jgi:hypothetical protein
VRGLATYCFAAGGFASGTGAGAAGSSVGVVPRSSDAAAQSPAQSLVPLTVPTNLQPCGAFGFTCTNGFAADLGRDASCAKALAEKQIATRTSRDFIFASFHLWAGRCFTRGKADPHPSAKSGRTARISCWGLWRSIPHCGALSTEGGPVLHPKGDLRGEQGRSSCR